MKTGIVRELEHILSSSACGRYPVSERVASGLPVPVQIAVHEFAREQELTVGQAVLVLLASALIEQHQQYDEALFRALPDP